MKIHSMFLRLLHYIIKIIQLKIIYLYTIVNVFDFLDIYNTVVSNNSFPLSIYHFFFLMY